VLRTEVLPHVFWPRPVLFTSPFQGWNDLLCKTLISNGFLCGTYSCYVEFITYYAIFIEWNRMPCPIHVNGRSSFHQRFPNIQLLGSACFDVYFRLLGLILQMIFYSFGEIKFVVVPWSSRDIQLGCVSFEIQIEYESLNFVWAFTIDAFPETLRSYWSNIFVRNSMTMLQLITSLGFSFQICV